MQLRLVTLLIVLAAAACDAKRSDAPLQPTDASAASIRIATFNLQAFGSTKARDARIVAQLATIIRRYDAVAVQEIKDASGEAPQLLLDAVNANGERNYAMQLSPRSGIQLDDTAFQEQYAVLYDTRVLTALARDQLFDDSERDLFQREPYATPFATTDGSFSFVLLTVHTQPDRALAEIDALESVFDWAGDSFPASRDVIALGDFNAGCLYASPAQLAALSLRGPDYLWIVPDSSDSNVTSTSACAYDRIVTTVATEPRFTGAWAVDQAFTDTSLSDHWPVWAELNVSPRED